MADQEYIVSSGNGYFVRFDGDTPFMDSDIGGATKVNKISAQLISDKLVDLGYYVELIGIIEVT